MDADCLLSLPQSSCLSSQEQQVPGFSTKLAPVGPPRFVRSVSLSSMCKNVYVGKRKYPKSQMATGTPEVGSQSQWSTVGVTNNSDSKGSRGIE